MANKTNHPAGKPGDWFIKGSRLALLTPTDKVILTPESFTKYYMTFVRGTTLLPIWTLFWIDDMDLHGSKENFLHATLLIKLNPTKFGNPFLHQSCYRQESHPRRIK